MKVKRAAVCQSEGRCYHGYGIKIKKWTVEDHKGGLVKCELRVTSCELRVASCKLLLFCELRVASCELRVAS